MTLSCPHLSKSVWNYKSVNNFIKRVELDKESVDSFRLDWVYYLCESCNQENEKITIFEFPEYFIQPSCAKCFKELSNLEN